MSDIDDTPDETAAPASGVRASLAAMTSGSLRSLPFVALLVTLLGAGMVGQLALNIAIQDQQLRLNKAQASAASLALEVSDKQARAYAAAAPGALASEAAKLGMVPNTYPGFIDLRTGAIVGSPKPVTGREMPGLATGPAKPAAPPSGTPSASPSGSATPQPSGQASTPGAKPTPGTKPTAKPSPTPSASATPKTKASATPTSTRSGAKPSATPSRR